MLLSKILKYTRQQRPSHPRILFGRSNVATILLFIFFLVGGAPKAVAQRVPEGQVFAYPPKGGADEAVPPHHEVKTQELGDLQHVSLLSPRRLTLPTGDDYFCATRRFAERLNTPTDGVAADADRRSSSTISSVSLDTSISMETKHDVPTEPRGSSLSPASAAAQGEEGEEGRNKTGAAAAVGVAAGAVAVAAGAMGLWGEGKTEEEKEEQPSAVALAVAAAVTEDTTSAEESKQESDAPDFASLQISSDAVAIEVRSLRGSYLLVVC